MGILSRWRERGAAFLARRLQRLQGEARSVSLAIPGRHGPLCEVRLEAASEPQADGERVRVRSHLHLRLPRGRDLNTWFEVRASNASLDEGAAALVPEKLNALGVAPVPDKPLQTWAGALQGRRPGFAVLSLLRLDKSSLPSVLKRLLGARPFQLSATLANTVEDA
jgi:hypothetical protein